MSDTVGGYLQSILDQLDELKAALAKEQKEHAEDERAYGQCIAENQRLREALESK